MSVFLSFFPDDKSNAQISAVSDNVKEVFEGLGIAVRWSNPKTYHSTLLFLGKGVSPIKIAYLRYKLKKFRFEKFSIKFNSIKLGISRKYRELIFLDFLEGGEQMRELYLQLKQLLNEKSDINFIPHLTLGRVNKDLSGQESANIIKDLANVSKKMNVNKISFEVSEINLVKAEDDNYIIQMSITAN